MTDQGTSVIRPLRRSSAGRVLVCLGFCGGGTGPYRAWAGSLPEDTDLALVCYPGREGRFAEPFAASWDELAADATAAVRRAADRPYVLFGHSMGGWMAFDVATRIERTGGPAPDMLIVSSCNAPSRGVTDRDRFPRIEDGETELMAWMRTTGSLPDYAADDPDLREMAVELMRADIRVRDSYRPLPGARTGAAVQVLHGADDPVIDPAVGDQWRAVSGPEFHLDRLPGGHFYTRDVWRTLPVSFRTAASALERTP